MYVDGGGESHLLLHDFSDSEISQRWRAFPRTVAVAAFGRLAAPILRPCSLLIPIESITERFLDRMSTRLTRFRVGRVGFPDC